MRKVIEMYNFAHNKDTDKSCKYSEHGIERDICCEKHTNTFIEVLKLI